MSDSKTDHRPAAINPPLPAETIDLFLCHNGADKPWVKELAEQVESETYDGTPGGRRLHVWYDEWDIEKGENVVVSINRGLAHARFVAVVISPEFLRAPWPTFEWTHVVADDPTNRRGRLLPLFVRDYSEALQARAEFPAPFKVLNWIDFRKKAEFKQGFRQLITKLRDQKPARGRQRPPLASAAAPVTFPVDRPADAPDASSEIIVGNLLPVVSYPQTMWFAGTTARAPQDVGRAVKDADPFVLQDAKLFSFCDLSSPNSPLRAVVDTRTVGSVRVADWSGDPVRWRWVIALFNRCLRQCFYRLPVFRDERGRYYFVPNKDGTDRVWQNGSDPKRMVAAKKENAEKTQFFWVHHAAWLAFTSLGGRLYLHVEPSYLFTSDGRTPLTGKSVGPLSVKWGGKERNAAILRHIIFWGRTLARDTVRIEIPTGGQPVVVSAVPAHAQAAFGIADDNVAVRSLLEQVDDELDLVANELGQEVLDGSFESEEDDGEQTPSA